MKEYPIITLPSEIYVALNRKNLSDLKKYFSWFQEQIPIRLQIFCNYVFKNNAIIFDDHYLHYIDIFLKQMIKIRNLDTKEIAQKQLFISNASNFEHKFRDYEFIEPLATTIIYDAGIYFAELLRANINGLFWKLDLNKNKISYGCPILYKKELNLDLEPYRILNIHAHQVLMNSTNNKSITDLYNLWKDKLNGKKSYYDWL